ncbi:1,6-anhydro-N-acetylmuramyl-L-alanine amidase AmpD [Thalassotalea sediminis]|uniref:1,6-anhydro-N-acetylmuramyl-L-alanine amidase AmpD n=1 Tax=Thalassotalea sediminis TaxID=1759089 RepID=UPI002573BC68|nr:1,6-anhydro-N-acetylmuramyl-L-alanine amidase AmpD [Thalassotalea sediminis]
MDDSLSQSEDKIVNGWYLAAEKCPSPHYDEREQCSPQAISLLVIHNISLPPGQFGGSYISDLFLGKLDKNAHPSFKDIYQLRVSAHCLIRRDGTVIQYVSFNNRAWHAGVSSYLGKEKCNDFSIGIELEGTDDTPYTTAQYNHLARLTTVIKSNYRQIGENIVGHCDIAPERKTDPGRVFDWQRYKQLLA